MDSLWLIGGALGGGVWGFTIAMLARHYTAAASNVWRADGMRQVLGRQHAQAEQLLTTAKANMASTKHSAQLLLREIDALMHETEARAHENLTTVYWAGPGRYINHIGLDEGTASSLAGVEEVRRILGATAARHDENFNTDEEVAHRDVAAIHDWAEGIAAAYRAVVRGYPARQVALQRQLRQAGGPAPTLQDVLFLWSDCVENYGAQLCELCKDAAAIVAEFDGYRHQRDVARARLANIRAMSQQMQNDSNESERTREASGRTVSRNLVGAGAAVVALVGVAAGISTALGLTYQPIAILLVQFTLGLAVGIIAGALVGLLTGALVGMIATGRDSLAGTTAAALAGAATGAIAGSIAVWGTLLQSDLDIANFLNQALN